MEEGGGHDPQTPQEGPARVAAEARTTPGSPSMSSSNGGGRRTRTPDPSLGPFRFRGEAGAARQFTLHADLRRVYGFPGVTALEGERKPVGACPRTRTETGRLLRPLPLPIGLRRHADVPGGGRTLTVRFLRPPPLPVGLQGRGCRRRRVTSGSRGRPGRGNERGPVRDAEGASWSAACRAGGALRTPSGRAQAQARKRARQRRRQEGGDAEHDALKVAGQIVLVN
jgi:hypothetical protein